MPDKSRLFNLSQGTKEDGTFLRLLSDKSRLCNEVIEESKAEASIVSKARFILIVTCFKPAQPKKNKHVLINYVVQIVYKTKSYLGNGVLLQKMF